MGDGSDVPKINVTRSLLVDNCQYVLDDIGFVDLVDHMGSDLTVVNAARVSFDKQVESISDADVRLIHYLSLIHI